MKKITVNLRIKRGGAGSGNWGHEGVPGQLGGSAGGGGGGGQGAAGNEKPSIDLAEKGAQVVVNADGNTTKQGAYYTGTVVIQQPLDGHIDFASVSNEDIEAYIENEARQPMSNLDGSEYGLDPSTVEQYIPKVTNINYDGDRIEASFELEILGGK